MQLVQHPLPKIVTIVKQNIKDWFLYLYTLRSRSARSESFDCELNVNYIYKKSKINVLYIILMCEIIFDT